MPSRAYLGNQVRSWISSQNLSVPLRSQIRNVETNQCVDNMGRKENEKVGFFNCHGMGGNQVSLARASKCASQTERSGGEMCR